MNQPEIIDRVCGMNISGFKGVAETKHGGEAFYFCGDDCKLRFQNNPGKFLGTPLIRLNNVWKIFKMGETETQVLRGLDLNVWEGDFVSIIGASGSGKSTALNMIGLLDRPTKGEISLNGQNVAELDDEGRALLRSATFGFVFQQYNLVPWLTAYENVTLPIILAGKNIDAGRIQSGLEQIGLGHRAKHRPFELSGGEQQRIALLRALANDPKIIIGDEPTGNLDSATGNKILEMLINLNKKEKKTLIVVTHDADIAGKADQVVAMKDGRLVRDHHVYKKTYTE